MWPPFLYALIDLLLLAWLIRVAMALYATGKAEQRRRGHAVTWLIVAILALLLTHVGTYALRFANLNLPLNVVGNPSFLPFLIGWLGYLGFAFACAMAAGCLLLRPFANPQTTARQASGALASLAPSTSPTTPNAATTSDRRPGPRLVDPDQPLDWHYMRQQLRLFFFRSVGLLLPLAAGPLAISQGSWGVGLMAVVTGGGCLWLGFHRRSPLAIRYAALAEEEDAEAN